MATHLASRRPEQRALTNNAVLVVDDEADIRELLELSLIRMGLDVEAVGSIAQAKSRLAEREFNLCLTDMRLPDGEGLEIVRHIGANCTDLPVAVITAYGSAENAVAALKAGAFDYLTKPLSLEQLRTLVKSALHLPARPNTTSHTAARMLGEGPAITQVRLIIEKLARSQAPVYITGESGSGKELAARMIHGGGARAEKPFVAVNCGAIPENLIESEFFGYRKGAFTGADTDRDGFFHAANGGTLFLDEVADLPLPMQVKLLRAVQEKMVRKVGATGEEPVDVRLISATHQNLQSCVAEGRFRQDLYYRLAVIELKMPSLKERIEDVGLLVDAFLARQANNSDKVLKLSPRAQKALEDYGFPGNVRELENILERAAALSSGDTIDVEELQLAPSSLGGDSPTFEHGKSPLPEYLDRLEREAILDALDKTRFNRTAAAKLLGITFRALRYRMERLNIR
ncbi:MAG: sigma-54-dependent transcriptional regulator [Burkholderiales bacterium]